MKKVLFYLLLVVVAFSCEEEFIPEASANIDEIVVEGYIEAGEGSSFPYVILRKALPFFAEFSANALDDAYVHDAKVEVTNNDEVFEFTEICLNDLTEEQKVIIGPLLGVDVDSLALNICVYLDLTFSLQGEHNQTYDLLIEAGDRVLTSTTTIPSAVALDSIWFIEIPGVPVDTLRNMRVNLTDPGDEVNFYRYFVAPENEAFETSAGSVFNDGIVDGKSLPFNLNNPTPVDTTSTDIGTFGSYLLGENITLKWAGIDQAHYDFWSSLELNQNNQGPFANYTLVSTNIEGGLGIWGGYSINTYELTVE